MTSLKIRGFDKRSKTNDVDFAERLFTEIVRPRETIIRFGEARTVLADNPARKLKELFAYYGERNFVTRKHQEALLESEVRRLLFRIHVGDRFDRVSLGDDNYHVTCPFVRRGDDEPVKIIKPLHLAHQEPTRIYEHGAAWFYRINRLKGRYLDPDRVLFTLAGPDKDENRLLAYHEIEEELQGAGVKTVAFDKQDEITRFSPELAATCDVSDLSTYFSGQRHYGISRAVGFQFTPGEVADEMNHWLAPKWQDDGNEPFDETHQH